MARTPKGYWEKRSTSLMENIERNTEKTINDLINIYEQATKNINKEISNIFKNYSKDGVLNDDVLKQMLTVKETDTYYKNLLQVINNNITDDNIKKKMLAKYNAPAYSYRINRYQALQELIDVELKKAASEEAYVTRLQYIDTIKEGYYHNIFDIQKGLGLNFNFSQIDNKTIKALLSNKWIDNGNYSKRIWENSEALNNYLKTQLTASSLTGKSIQKISIELSSYMNVGMFYATRLVRTEVNHFANEAEALSYQECGIERYRFIVTLDARTCVNCAKLDNRIFSVKERMPGKNYPPLHPNDRCTTVAVFDDEELEDLKRRARDENGKNITIPAEMSYKEWSMQYAPEQYKTFLNSSLPKVKPANDSVLQKRLGFYEKDIDGKLNLKFIPKSSIITNVHIIAGKGTKTIFRNANLYAQKYGGKTENWMKKAGKIESDKYIFDIHWVEHNVYGFYDPKIGGKKEK